MRKRQHVSTIETRSPQRSVGGSVIPGTQIRGAAPYIVPRNGGPLHDVHHQGMPNNIVVKTTILYYNYLFIQLPKLYLHVFKFNLNYN